MSKHLVLVSHALCPYVQRIAIALAEKGIAYERVTIDLAAKPAWFVAISPLGKVPLLQIDEHVLFESAVILEYLEEAFGQPLHPRDPLQRADHRAWMEYGSVILNDIAGLYNAQDEASFDAKWALLGRRFQWLEERLIVDPWFDGTEFSLVDAVFGPIFRYFDVFDTIDPMSMIGRRPKVERWRKSLAARPSVRDAVTADYPSLLRAFLLARKSYISQLLADKSATTAA
jgi:glutathione S-transferase